MQEQLITFDTAKLAKEKGFDIPCNSYIYTPEALQSLNENREFRTGDKETFKKDHIFTQRNKYHKGREVDRNQYPTTIALPTQSLLQKWLREVHGLDVESRTQIGSKGKVYYYYIDCTSSTLHYESYEEALEVGLFEALKQITIP